RRDTRRRRQGPGPGAFAGPRAPPGRARHGARAPPELARALPAQLAAGRLAVDPAHRARRAGHDPGRGAPAIQTPDLWSIPFAPPEPARAPAPEELRAVLGRLLGRAPAGPLAYGEELAQAVDRGLDQGWLRPSARVRAGRALTAL
ncbi:MAG TPA: hypothetical protein VK951_10215, partial [Miltoncostaeaceae bacterium]|nr:hypothetical protein [Miltoncostaeaceae bacterium]